VTLFEFLIFLFDYYKSGLDGSRTRVQKLIRRPSTIIVSSFGKTRFPLG